MSNQTISQTIFRSDHPTRFGGFPILYTICYTFQTIPVYSLKDEHVPCGKGGDYATQDEHVYSRRATNES